MKAQKIFLTIEEQEIICLFRKLNENYKKRIQGRLEMILIECIKKEFFEKLEKEQLNNCHLIVLKEIDQ